MSFFAALGLLLIVIAAASFLGKPPVEETKTVPEKAVTVYSIGSSARTLAQGKVEKTGVLTLNAQVPGVVSRVKVTEGQAIRQGAPLLNLASNYNGGSLPAQQLALANKQFKFQAETRDMQKSLIDKQRQAAEANAQNAEELRKISEQSVSSLNEQISLNGDILSSIDANITNLEETNSGGVNDDLIEASKQLKSQFLAAQSQLEQAKRSTEYTVNEANPPTQLTNLSKDIALKQLELQEKSLDLNYELARVNQAIAAISASLMNPTAPFSGTVERVHIREGQGVTPGMPLVSLSGQTEGAKIVVGLPASMAKRVSELEPAMITMDNQEYPLELMHVTSETLEDQLARVILNVPEEVLPALRNNAFVTVSLPLGYPEAAGALPIIPIDTVHQTQQGAYVFLIEDGLVVSREIKLGQVLGDRVEVLEGLATGDVIIVNRSVTAGEKVKIE